MIRNQIRKYFFVKEELIRDPGQHLGGKLWEVVTENGAKACDSRSKQYVESAVRNGVEYFPNRSQKLVSKAVPPLSSGYCPEVDVTGHLDAADSS